MKTHRRPLLASLAFLALSSIVGFAAESFSVYSAQNGLADGWKTGSWNGPVVNEIPVPASGTTQLRVEIRDGSQPFCGVVLSDAAGNGLALTDQLRQSGVVTIHLTPGKTAHGEVASQEQPVQFALSFVTTDGQTIHAPFKDQGVISLSPEGAKTSLTVANALGNVKTPPGQIASLSAVRIQFLGQPVVGFNIVECSIKAE